MADPKLTRIMTALAARLENIRKANGYYTDIGQTVSRYPRVYNHYDQSELPACAIYLEGGENDGSAGVGVKTSPLLIVRACHSVAGIAEDIAIKMLADIHRAIEQPSSTVPQRPDIIQRIDETGWVIVYPENLTDVISVEMNYSFSYSRRYGED